MFLDTESDLSWDAFRYASGEVSADESAAFEARMEHDQAAREALAEAVELIGALALAGPGADSLVIPLRRSSRVRRILGLSLASVVAAAAVLLAMVRPEPTPLRNPTPDSTRVALAWSGLRGDDFATWVALIESPAPSTAAAPAPFSLAGLEQVEVVEDLWTTAEAERGDASSAVDVAADVGTAPADDLDSATDRALPSWLVAAASGRSVAPSKRKDD